jgi:DNA-binding transcriptional regulator GbsR (MarR family)
MDDKYNKLCEINKLIYKDIQDNQSIIVGEYSESNSFYRKCETMVRERIQRETQYTKLLMIQKSTQILNETTKAYTKTHFVEEKLMGLRNLITKVKDFFQTIVQQAPASKVCN